MAKNKQFRIFCHFSTMGKKTIDAASLDEAMQIVEADDSVQFDEIVRLTEACKVDESLSHQISESEPGVHHDVEFKSWGTE